MILPRQIGPRPVAWRRALQLVLGAALLVNAPNAAPAHEIPARVTVLAFVKPEGERLRVVMRVPLAAMRDHDFPLNGDSYLDIPGATPMLPRAATLWLADYLELFEDGRALGEARVTAARVSLPSDRSFESYERAVANLAAPMLPAETAIPWTQAMLDVALEYPIHSARSHFSVHPALAHLGLKTSTVLRFLPPDGGERAFRYDGDPGLVQLDPRWHQAALSFVRLGVLHILGGIDHLLFVLCLVIPFRKVRPLLVIVTSFTVGHSITLVASSLGVAPDALWFPPLIEVLVALSIVYMAFENIVGPRLERRWLIAFGFGLVHGFAFSFALRESMQFAGAHLAAALVAFNVGVEVGQVLVLAVAVPALVLLFKHVVAERMGTILLSALVAHTAWHWMVDRGAALAQYRFTLPEWNLALLVSAMRGAMLLLVALGALWLLSTLSARLSRHSRAPRARAG